MRKILFIIALVNLVTVSILAVGSFIIICLRLIANYYPELDIQTLIIFDIVFWISGRILAGITRQCYDEMVCI